MKTIEWNEEQRKAFQDLLREFVVLIDAKVQEEKQTGKTPTNPKYASYQKRAEQVFNAMGLCVQNQSWQPWAFIP